MAKGKIGLISVLSFTEGDNQDTGKELLLLLLILILQIVLIPSFSINIQTIDLISPWLAYKFICKPIKQSALLFVIASLTLETTFATSAGLYLSTYFVLLLTISYLKENISWKKPRPWVTFLGAACLWVGIFEIYAYWLKSGTPPPAHTIYLQLLGRSLLGGLFGFILFKNSSMYKKED